LQAPSFYSSPADPKLLSDRTSGAVGNAKHLTEEEEMMITDRVKPPPRESGLTVRLSEDERKRLEAYAVRHDLRLGQVLRRLVRELPNALDSPRDCA